MTLAEQIRKHVVVAILRGVDAQYIPDLTQALYDGGIRLIECTFDQKNPESWRKTADSIRNIALRYPDVSTGAGTVLTVDQLHAAFDAGARYFVAPNVNPEIIAEAKRLGMGAIPGAMTPTEITAADAAGADVVKLFPAGTLGVGYVRAICAPLAHIPLLAASGIDAGNIRGFLDAGAIGAGVSGPLTGRALLETGQFDAIRRAAEELLNA